MPLTPNTTLLNGKYRIVDKIGEGGMARVWLAEEVHFGRQVAIKEPQAGLGSTDSEELRQRFQREVKVSAALAKANAPNIVPALTAEPYEDSLLLVLAYMPGGDLETLLRQHPQGLPLERVLAIAADVLAALAAVHSHRLEIVHRDIKPSNILFDGEGRAHLGDFGLAQVAGWSAGRSVLMGGSHPGTPLYMAPEQVRETGYLMPAADIYALGCVLFEMLTGQKYKRYEPGTRAASLRPDTPAWLDDLLAQALAEDRWQRSGDGRAMQQAWDQRLQAERRRQEEDEARRQREEEEARRQREAEAEAEERRLREQTQAAERKQQQEEEARKRREAEAEKRRAAETARLRAEQEATQRREQDDHRRKAEASPVAAGRDVDVAGWPSHSRWKVIVPLLVAAAVAVIWFANRPAPFPNPALPTATALPTLAPDETPVIGSAMVSERDGMEMVYVPAGDFLMGSPEGEGYGDERPQHTVYLDAYWIDKTEVTNAQYGRCVAAGGCQSSSYANENRFNGSSQPVVGVSWEDARNYCTWAGRRLPTEAEWEKAARGTDGRKYPWGDAWDVQSTQRLNFADKNMNSDWSDKNADDGYEFTAPVGSYPFGASPYGALDMAGNVWEWAADWYDRGYYSSSPARNPAGPESGQYRVLRGGSWDGNDFNVRSANRDYSTPGGRLYFVGFRCARS